MKLGWFKQSLAVAAFGAFSSVASAGYIATIEGNDCAGVFGQGFNDCKIPTQYDPNQTPVIIKFDVVGSALTLTEINSGLFPTIDGSEFSFSGSGSTGTWTYNPGAGDPVINFFVAKGGPDFNLFSNLGDPLSDSWFTPTNPNNQQLYGLSHLTFYDSNGQQIPEPASLALLGLGLAGLAMVRRRKR